VVWDLVSAALRVGWRRLLMAAVLVTGASCASSWGVMVTRPAAAVGLLRALWGPLSAKFHDEQI